MFRNNKPKKKSTYQSFDQWAKSARSAIDNFQKELERELEEEKESNKKTYESKQRPRVFRQFSNNKEVKEIFPRTNNPKSQSLMDKKSHEGKVNKKGSIEGNGLMGREGDPVNPELRKRLEEKRAKEKRQRSQKNTRNSKNSYQRKSETKAIKKEEIASFKKSLKNKEIFRKAILASEIIGPPVSKRK